mmetsp:Transcript_16053/g.32896  ORF Transcript_16053/g.32896 Transcript_16053/m.32896 type:complete len:117 (+) Transcript_16053:2355-2705(+)|eukprot:CAMPEP_0168197092 /NCGR_PEP_ID=MMETSP0139_2-20121125/20936_1 /TAXON_ID=44445 /ORGANISM="Pseudo-nitzschia australis, Strain 10249 10 AB" /LENGTH=116 /DNA_ID=CAMNT_0008121453 /DNA_START=299 /DNA_END=649 /DNA_ORIENTATION=+
MTGGSPVIFAPIKSNSRSRDVSIAFDNDITSTEDGVSGPPSITKRTVTLSAEDTEAFWIKFATSSSLERTLEFVLSFFLLGRRREANDLDAVSILDCRNNVSGFDDTFQEDSPPDG